MGKTIKTRVAPGLVQLQTLNQHHDPVYNAARWGRVDQLKALLVSQNKKVSNKRDHQVAQFDTFCLYAGWVKHRGDHKDASGQDAPWSVFSDQAWAAFGRLAPDQSVAQGLHARWLLARQLQDDPLEAAFEAPEHRFEVLQLLLDHGYKPSTLPADPQGALLYLAAQLGDVTQLTKFLNQAPQALAATAAGGWTALHAAALHGQAGAVSVLMKAGAQLDQAAGPLGWTPLHVAARELAHYAQNKSMPAYACCLETLKALLEHSSDRKKSLDVQTKDGWCTRDLLGDALCEELSTVAVTPSTSIGTISAREPSYSDYGSSEASFETCLTSLPMPPLRSRSGHVYA